MASTGPSATATPISAHQALLNSFIQFLENSPQHQQELDAKLEKMLAMAPTQERVALTQKIVQISLDLDRFRYVAKKLAEEVTTAPEGVYKGENVAWLLSGLAKDGDPKDFLKVWERFEGELKLGYFLELAKEGYYKGKNPLCLLAHAVANGGPASFLKFWERFGSELKLDHLLEPAQGGVSLLWLLAYGSYADDSAFLKVWERFEGEFELKHLLVPAQETQGIDDEGKNVLWLLADGLVQKSEAFLKVWKKFKGELELKHLLVPAQSVDEASKTALWFLLAHNGGKLLKEIFSQVPGTIPESEFTNPVLSDKLQKLFDQQKESLIPLLKARNRFFSALDQLKQCNVLDIDTINNLLAEAEKAQAAGYYNAFYDVGKYLFVQGKIPEAFKAYEKVPAQSCHFQAINRNVFEHHFAASQQSLVTNEKQYYLRKALCAALQETNENERIMFILRIATCYIQDFQQKLDEPIAYNLVPSDLLLLMNSSTDPGWCFERFEEIKEKRRLREGNKELEKKIKMLEQQLAQAQETNAQLLKLNKIQAQQILELTQKNQTQQEHTHAEELFAAPALIFGATLHSNNEQVVGEKRVFESMHGNSIEEDPTSKKFKLSEL